VGVRVDTLYNRVRYHGMPQTFTRVVTHQSWTPADLERVSGLSPVALRDLRRRGLAPDSERRKLRLIEVGQLLLQSELVGHGFGPKRINAISRQYADDLVAHALDEPSSWTDEDSYLAWLDGPSSENKSRYVLLAGSTPQVQQVDTLKGMLSMAEPVVTVLDLKLLGQKLSLHLAERPSSLTTIGGGT
jgi:hypothetical protein